MNIPNLPTDNLYKFSALSGVAFALACGSLIAIKDVQLVERYTENIVGMKYLELQGKVPQDLLDAVSKSIREREKPLTEEEFEKEIVPMYEEITEIQAGLNDQLREFIPKSTDLAAQAMVLYRWRNQLVYGFWSGIGVAVIGFILWYVKLQRYQDVIVKKQALEFRKET